MALYLGNKFLTFYFKNNVDLYDKWAQQYIDYLDGYLIIPYEVESIRDSAFQSIEHIKSVSFENVSKCQSIGNYCFKNCPSLEEITLPESISIIGTECFIGCDNLTTITINKPENSISGAPWGATNATIIWNG